MRDPLALLAHPGPDPARALLGTEGYALPDLTGLETTTLPHGDGNIVHGPATGFTFDIRPTARNNTILIDRHCHCIGHVIVWGSDNLVVIRGAREGRNPINVHMFSDRGLFFFGDHATSNTATFEVCGDDKSILVGEDCMFSAFIDVGTDDRHGMFDVATGEHLNPPASVRFAPHVWVGLHATVLKGVEIGFGSIVAARTVVSRSMPELSVIGGVPATVLRSGTTWTRARDPHPPEQAHVLRDYTRYRTSP